ncbi:hypothetical protein [Sediminitomix flava]|uniref:Uncharacterized protein n=1 Tax=Sediminitomix flava TaxID=379075 RepID=A0A316A4A6_SEDFL|nr:hypothetical protein [Sediminitomix flava]PWJ44567.1 hypothetical protein BC781_101938 [Sediminitomix flava]
MKGKNEFQFLIIGVYLPIFLVFLFFFLTGYKFKNDSNSIKKCYSSSFHGTVTKKYEKREKFRKKTYIELSDGSVLQVFKYRRTFNNKGLNKHAVVGDSISKNAEDLSAYVYPSSDKNNSHGDSIEVCYCEENIQ